MKKTILLLVGVLFSPFAFGQTVSTLDQAIEQQVSQQTGAPADFTRVAPSAQPRRVTTDPQDSRIVDVGGKKYYLRKKERWAQNGQFDTHTYVSPDDTMTVELSQANFEIKHKNQNTVSVPAGFTITSDEELQNDPNRQSRIVACERQNPDGSCEYIVKKTERHVAAQPANANGVGQTQITKGTVTVRHTYAPGTDSGAQRANTYQSLKNTPVYPTFGVNLNRGGANDLYGPESYGK